MAELVEELCTLHELMFLGFRECTVMDREDEAIITSHCKWHQTECCALGASRVRRPRFYWTEPAIVEGVGVSLREGPRGMVMDFEGPTEPQDSWVLPGWRFVSEEDEGVKLPTFTRAIPRTRPPRGAPGLTRIRPHELARYAADWRRVGPYTYGDRFCLVAEGTEDLRVEQNSTARVACATERERS